MNRLRVVLLSILVLLTVAGALPLTESLAKWGRRSASAHQRRQRRHSRAWWRRHRARLRARRERAERRRRERAAANAANAAGAAGAANVPRDKAVPANAALLSFDAATAPAPAASPLASPAAPASAVARASQLPFDFAPPHTWAPARKTRPGSAVFSIKTPDGRSAGTAVVAPVSLSAAELAAAPASARAKAVGGLSLTALRRKVIDRMVAEGGWVTNDFVQEIRGRRVFVVLAQTGAPGAPTQTWAFYFTEVDGRVYSLATNAPAEFAAPLAAGSEQFMASLRSAADKSTASQR